MARNAIFCNNCPMKSTKPIYWLLLPVLLALSAGSIWGTLNFYPKQSASDMSKLSQCQNLRDFVISEEIIGQAKWGTYHSDVLKYKTGLSDQARTIALVKLIANEAIEVLQSDLRIYEEMDANRVCLTPTFEKNLSTVITDTQSSIDFLLGQGEISSQMFDPNQGTWNPAFYDAYESAVKYLK